MSLVNKKEPLVLASGDILFLVFSLLVTLTLRATGIPPEEFVLLHVLPFTIIFVVSILVFYISGLYGRAVNMARSSIPGTIIGAQIVNGLVAVLLFYFVPGFSVTPKLSLFIYLLISFFFVTAWRLHSYSLLSLSKKDPALVVGSGAEVDELIHEMKRNVRSSIVCTKLLDPAKVRVEDIEHLETDFRYIIADMTNPAMNALLPKLYERFFPSTSIVDLHEFYEDMFDRVPLSSMNYKWIMSNISSVAPKMHDILKRLVDIVFGIIVGAAACVAYPFIALAMKIEDGGPVFISQERMGKNNKPIHIYKYRSMERNDRGIWLKDSPNKVTRVGKFIRKTSIDELPQALAFLKGDMSLIGPRADIVDLGRKLDKEIPYYSVRTVITPGLSGWAQINQEKPPQSVEETKLRLSYDLYYIKHRSLHLDLRIILRTLKTLLSRMAM